VHIAEQSYGANVFCAFVVGLHLSYVLNDMINGDPNTATSESQGWYTTCLTTRSAITVLMSEFVTNGGSWWGRKKMLGLGQIMFVLACGTSIFALVINVVAMHLVANIWIGLVTGSKATMMAYVSDVSTTDTHKKNVAYVVAWGGGSLVAAMICYLVLPPIGGYAVSGALVTASLLLRQFGLPDCSPPLEKRQPPTCMRMLRTLFAAPYNVYLSFRTQTPYVKCLLFTQFFQYASLGTLHAYFANFVLIRFGMEQAEAGLWVASAGLLGGITATLGIMCLPLESAFWLMWVTPLYSLYITFMPAKHTMWSGFVFYLPRLIPLAQLDIIFYGQLSARRRHELAALENMLERLGYLAGAVAVGIYSPLWIENYQNGDQSVPAVPITSLFFDICVVLVFYLGTHQYKHLNMYGKFFMVVQEGADAEKEAAAFEITFAKGVKVCVKDEGGVVGTSEGKNAEGDKGAIAGCYRVRLEDGTIIESKPANLELIELGMEGA